MSVRDREQVVSSVSLHGMIQAGGDSIPKEYHRKVLKKIAQLTKVIYTLNTKNDENEQFVGKLKETHRGDMEVVLSDCTLKLKHCKEQLSLENREAEKMIQTLRESLVDAEKERDQVKEEQFAYRDSVEERLGIIKSQNSDRVMHLTKKLEGLKSDQAKQLREMSDIDSEFSERLKISMEDLKQKHQEEIKDLQGKFSTKAANDLSSLGEEFKSKIKTLKKNHWKEMEAMKSEVKNSRIDTEKKLLEEREEILQREFIQKEELKHQISALSNDLRTSRDKLALSEQRAADLLSQIEEGTVGTSKLRDQLKDTEDEMERLRTALREIKHELDISKEHYQQQSMEIKEMVATLGRMKARHVSNEGTIKNLQSQVSSLQQRNKILEEERGVLQSTQLTTNEYQSGQIKSLQKELDDVMRQKQDMRVQFAREIEAAHAQLSENEKQLGYKHLKALEEFKDASKKALLDATKERNTAIEELKKQLHSQKEREILSLKEKFESENSRLRNSLSDKTSELVLAQEEVKRLESDLAQREEGLGSASSSLEKLKREIVTTKRDLIAARREKDEIAKERDRLLHTVEDLKKKALEEDKAHRDQLKQIKIRLTGEMADTWKERLKQECGTLRQELSLRYNENSRKTLDELASLKDRAMEEVAEKWETDKKKLLDQILDLKRKLQEMQDFNSASLEDANLVSDSQITALRCELEDQDAKCVKLIEALKELHIKELRELKKDFADDKRELVKDHREQQDKAMHEIQKANQLAVDALKRKLALENWEEMEGVRLGCEKTVTEIREEMSSEHERDKERMNKEHGVEIQNYRKEIKKMITERKNEVSHYESIVGNLNTNIERRDAELSKLRGKVNSLTVTATDMRKELEVKAHEVLAVRRETNTILQQRVCELTSAHDIEMDSLKSQHRHQIQLHLADFNSAKALFVSKLKESEKKILEWERQSRQSKPEDLETIKELRVILQQQKQKMKDLVDEKHIYQLELKNREKNYNHVFNANPCVGVLNPLASRHRKHAFEIGNRYPSAPSLMSISPEPPSFPPPPPLSLTSMPGSIIIPHNPSATSSTMASITASAGQLFSRRELPQLEARPKRIVMLKDSPTVHKKYSNSKEKRDVPLKPIESIPPSSTGIQKINYGCTIVMTL